MDDRKIAEKINGLDQLPEYYSPNLELKWGIIEAGMDKSNKSVLIWWFSAAAVLLITTLLWFVQPSDQIADLPSPVLMHKHTSGTGLAKETEMRIAPAEKKKVTRKKQAKHQPPAITLPVEEINEAQQVVLSSPDSPAETLRTEIALQKPRYVEMDFSDGIEKSSPQTTIAAQQFRFKLGQRPAFSKSGNGIKQADIPLRIQKTF